MQDGGKEKRGEIKNGSGKVRRRGERKCKTWLRKGRKREEVVNEGNGGRRDSSRERV